MSGHSVSVLLLGLDSAFFDYASFHLAAHGIKLVPILPSETSTPATLVEAIALERPRLVLLHWDTLGDGALRTVAYLKACHADVCRAPIAILSEKLHGGVDIISAFSSGADDLIEGALNPRILIPRIKAALGYRTQPLPVRLRSAASLG